MMNFRNAQYNAIGTIDCEIEHPVYGWIPFTADLDDVEPLGAEVFNDAQSSATAYVEPVVDPAEALAAWRLNGFLSRAEFCVNANAMGLLTDADAEKAAAGAWPDSFEPIIASWPAAERIRARSKWATNANIYRNDPLLLLLAASLTPNLTDAQLDTLCGWAG